MRHVIAITIASGLLSVVGASDRFVVKVGGYGPRTEVRLSRPTLKWEIWPADEPSKVRFVEFRLDGKAVDAKYDEKLRAVVYTPTAPLSTGAHKVECRITFENGATFRQDWETRISSAPLADLPPANASQNQALEIANRYRSVLGLPAFAPDPRLNQAALLHSLYLSQNDVTGHDEKPGTPGYLAATGAERLESFGWIGSSWEGVNYGTDSMAESIQGLFDAPYHRIPFLQPGEIAFGAGYANKRCTIEFGASETSDVVVSPAAGQTGVPCEWRNFEKPNPLRIHRTDVRATGYPIVLAAFAPGMPKLGVLAANLFDAAGRPVPCWLNTPANDDQLKNAAILIPQQRLKPKAAYTAKFLIRDNAGQTSERVVSFVTGPK